MHDQLSTEQKAELEGKYGTNNFVTFTPNEKLDSHEDYIYDDEENNKLTQQEDHQQNTAAKILKEDLVKNNSL